MKMRNESGIVWAVALTYYVIVSVILFTFLTLLCSDSVGCMLVGLAFYVTLALLCLKNTTIRQAMKVWAMLGIAFLNKVIQL